MSCEETVELRGWETVPLEDIGEGNLFPVVGLVRSNWGCC